MTCHHGGIWPHWVPKPWGPSWEMGSTPQISPEDDVGGFRISLGPTRAAGGSNHSPDAVTRGESHQMATEILTRGRGGRGR